MRIVRMIRNRLERKVGKHVVREQIRRHAKNLFTLDFGCGQSVTADAFPRYVGMDIRIAEGVGVVGDAHAVPFRDATFEQILCSEVLEHLREPERAIAEMARVLRPGGSLLLTVPFAYPVHEAPVDYQRFTPYGLETRFRPYFDIEEISPLFTEEETIAVLLQRIAFQRNDRFYRRYLYHALAHAIFRFVPRSRGRRYQDIRRTTEGPFLTAGFLLRARRRP